MKKLYVQPSIKVYTVGPESVLNNSINNSKPTDGLTNPPASGGSGVSHLVGSKLNLWSSDGAEFK